MPDAKDFAPIRQSAVWSDPVLPVNQSSGTKVTSTTLLFKYIEIAHPLSKIVKGVGCLTSNNVGDVFKFLQTLICLVNHSRIFPISEQNVMKLLLSITTRYLYNAIFNTIQNCIHAIITELLFRMRICPILFPRLKFYGSAVYWCGG